MVLILPLIQELGLIFQNRNNSNQLFKRIPLLFLVSFSILSHGQIHTQLDSLKKIDLNNYPDSIVKNIYTTLANKSSDPQEKIKYANLLLNVSSNDPLSLMQGNMYIGIAKRNNGDFKSALEFYFKSLEYAKQLTFSEQSLINLTIGDTYKSATHFENAYKFYSKARILYQDNGVRNEQDSANLTVVYTNIGDLFLLQRQYDSALINFKKAENLALGFEQEYYLAAIQGNIAIVYAAIGEIDSAEKEIVKCVNRLIELQYWDIGVDFLRYLVEIYEEQEKFSLALKYARQMEAISTEYGLKSLSASANLKLSEIMQSKGEYDSALSFYKKYVSLKDSVLNLETVQKMADQRTEFEVGQKQTELDLVSAQKKTQEIILYAVVGGAFLLLALIVVIYRNSLEKNRINKILADQKTQLEDLNHTKDKLFSIISHDLRSPVHAFAGIGQLIKFAVEDNSHEELLEISGHVEKTSKDLSDLLDGLLSWALQQQGNFKYEPEKINCKSLTDEISGIFLYAAKSKNIKLTSDISNDLEIWADKNMTLTIIRNLVNNALKFTDEGGEVSMSASEEGELVKIRVSDNGIGIPEDKLNTLFKSDGSKASYGTAGEKGLGLGLQLVYEFVSMNNGTVEVESAEGKGTTFIVSLPKYNS